MSVALVRRNECVPKKLGSSPMLAIHWQTSRGMGPLLALQRRLGRGKASRLCPCSSDVDLFGDGESVIDLNAEVAHRTLNLLVAQQKLDRPQIASATVYECRLGSTQ